MPPKRLKETLYPIRENTIQNCKTTAKYQYTATRNIIPSSTAFTPCHLRPSSTIVASNYLKHFRSVQKNTNTYRLLKETLRFEWYFGLLFFVILDLLKINYLLSVIDAPLGTYLSEPPNLQIFISSHHDV
jgi:hypothetical protein